jgi:hypothetical protein
MSTPGSFLTALVASKPQPCTMPCSTDHRHQRYRTTQDTVTATDEDLQTGYGADGR